MDGSSLQKEIPTPIADILTEKEKALWKLRDEVEMYSLRMDGAPTPQELMGGFFGIVQDFLKIDNMVPGGISTASMVSLGFRQKFGPMPAEVDCEKVLDDYGARYSRLCDLAREVWPGILSAQFDQMPSKRMGFGDIGEAFRTFVKRKPWTKTSEPAMPVQRVIRGYHRLTGKKPQP